MREETQGVDYLVRRPLQPGRKSVQDLSYQWVVKTDWKGCSATCAGGTVLKKSGGGWGECEESTAAGFTRIE